MGYWGKYLVERALDNLLAICIWDPGEEVPDRRIGLPVDLFLGFWYRLGNACLMFIARVFADPNKLTRLLDNDGSDVMSDAMYLLREQVARLRMSVRLLREVCLWQERGLACVGGSM